VSATAIWTVHCSRCARWDLQCETKGEAQRIARKDGWLVTRDENVCPTCRRMACSPDPTSDEPEAWYETPGDVTYPESADVEQITPPAQSGADQ